MEYQVSKSANQIATLAEKIFPNITVRKTDRDYVFTLDGYHHSSQPISLVDAAAGENLNVLARAISIDFFKLKLQVEL
jgi:hypothetical protein